MSDRLWIRDGHLIDPANAQDAPCDVFVANGRVAALGKPPNGFVPDRVINAKGRYVMPGFIDSCARLREPGFEHKATISSEARAAAAGGFTTVFCAPDTDPVIDTPAVVNLIRSKSQEQGGVRVLPIGALTRGLKGKDLSEMCALKEAGCHAVTNGWAALASSRVLRRAMEYAASHQLLVVIRPGDAELTDGGCVHEGPIGTRLGLPGIPDAAETVAIAQALALAEHTGARLHFGQLSSARAARMIGRARERGLPVSADVAAHQLHLTEDDVAGFDAMCHVYPPLRGVSDRDALRAAVRDGVIGAICSDHQPHEPDAKLDAFPATEPGISALESVLPLVLKLVDDKLIGLSTAVAALTRGPAAVMGLDGGHLGAGARADICVADPEALWAIDSSSWRSAGQNTPYWGQPMRGRVTHTVVEGRLVFALNVD